MWDMLKSDRWERNWPRREREPGDIDYVMCTHLHVDHVGGIRARKRTLGCDLPESQVLVADSRAGAWTAQEKKDQASCPWITDIGVPIVAAGRHRWLKSDYTFSELVRLVPTPGHTIDHFSVLVGPSGRTPRHRRMIHSPIQARYPELGMRVDYDFQAGGQSPAQIFERFCDTSTRM